MTQTVGYTITIVDLFFWWLWMIFDRGYGWKKFWSGATGKQLTIGREISPNREIMEISRSYFLSAYGIPKRLSVIALWVVMVAIISFVVTSITLLTAHSFGKMMMWIEVLCVFILVCLYMKGRPKVERGEILRAIAMRKKGIAPLYREVNQIQVDTPARWLDMVSLRPSLAAISFFLAAILGAIISLTVFPSQVGIPDLPYIVYVLSNMFSLPIFLGFSLIGVYSWPTTTPDRYYYPLFVLHRDLDKKVEAKPTSR